MPQASSYGDFTSSCKRRAYPDGYVDQIKVVAMLPAAWINVKKISEEFMGGLWVTVPTDIANPQTMVTINSHRVTATPPENVVTG